MSTLEYVPPVYISCADTAKMIRKDLKAAFPGVKFSVRSHSYAGGASIDIRWTDGPTSTQVDAITGRYQGSAFDGMVDLEVGVQHWMMPDGTITIAHRDGTNGSLVEIIGDPIGPDAKLVHFLADYVQTWRDISDEWRDEILRLFEEKLGQPVTGCTVPLHVTRDGDLFRITGDDAYVDDLVHRYAAARAR